jgi:adenosylcobinamide-GDP ribazoletransferase
VRQGLGRGPLALATLLAGLATAVAWALGLRQVWQPATAAVLAALVWTWYLKRRMGGQTGDLLGAGNQLVEAVVLLVLLAR